MISTKQKNVFTAIYEYRLHGTQRYVSQPQRRRREFAYKFQIQYRNIKRNKQQNTFQFYPLQHPLQISGKTDFCQATRKVYGSRLNKPLSERVINGRCQDIAHARACRHFDDIWTIADDQKFLSRFFRKQFLIKVSLLPSGNDNLQCERNSFKIHFHR